MKHIFLILVVFIFMGCSEQPSTPNIIKVKQRCLEDSTLMRPDFIAEEGDNVQFTQAVFTNNERRKSYIYELESEREKCR